MGAPSTKNVAAFKPDVGGGVLYAPAGTALPTDADTALDTAFVPLGYLSEDGIQPNRDTSIDKVKAWGGDVVAALKTDDSRSFVFTLYEVFSGDVEKFVYGADNVTVTAATTSEGTKLAIQDKATKPEDCVLVFEMKYEDKKRRVVIPLADSSVTSEGAYTDGGLGSYEITTEALKDDSGVRVYDYYSNDDLAAA